MTKFFDLTVPIEKPGQKKHWHRIGSGTEFKKADGSHGIACTIEAIPLNWNGEFCMFPSEPRKPFQGKTLPDDVPDDCPF